MNAQTETEKLSGVDKQDYRRNQYGGSFGGPIVKNKAHFFGAAERTQQDTKQSRRHAGTVPGQDGIFTTPYRENLVDGEGHDEPDPGAVPVGPLRPQHELAAVRRRTAGGR